MSMKSFYLLFILLISASGHAVNINHVNGSLNVVYVDFSVPGYAVPLELVRSYNSITALNERTGWSGVFGWGWTSPLETTLSVTPEKKVILRDGGTGNNILFSPPQTDEKELHLFLKKIKKAYFKEQKRRKLSESELSSLKLPEHVDQKLKLDPLFRTELANRYKVMSLPSREKMVSSDYGYQTLQLVRNQWVREKDGISQIFDLDGRLIRQVDKNGFFFEYVYSDSNKFQISEVRDQDKVTSIRFKWKKDRIVSAQDNRGRTAIYDYDGLGNLSKVTDSNQQSYAFKYENKKFPHLLTEILYASESKGSKTMTRIFRYDTNGLVSFHKDKEGNETSYSYGKNPNLPENQFWTKIMQKTASGTLESFEEFTLKERENGTKYLYKLDSKKGESLTSTIYSACCGKPLQINKDGEVTTFKYTDEGLLKEKKAPGEDIYIEYEPRWKKVSKVVQNGITSKYDYDQKGNLTRATNTKKESVSLYYDKYGRITQLTNLQGKKINFKYGNLGKPVFIADRSIGSVKISYDPDGKILKTEALLASAQQKANEEQAKNVIRQILMGFQNLLDIIRPAGLAATLEASS